MDEKLTRLMRHARYSVMLTGTMPHEVRATTRTLGLTPYAAIFGMKVAYDQTIPDGEVRFYDSTGGMVGRMLFDPEAIDYPPDSL